MPEMEKFATFNMNVNFLNFRADIEINCKKQGKKMHTFIYTDITLS